MNNNGRKTLCKEEFQGCEIVKENQQLKKQLEASEKARKDAIEELYIWRESLTLKFQQKMLNILDIDKGE